LFLFPQKYIYDYLSKMHTKQKLSSSIYGSIFLQTAMECGFDFIVAPLADPSRRPTPPTLTPTGALIPPFLPHQVMHTMSSVQISNRIVGKVSAWIDLDAEDESQRRDSLAALHQELAWASHLTVQAVLLPSPPHGSRSHNYARAIAHAIVAGTAGAALWLLIPATTTTTTTASKETTTAPPASTSQMDIEENTSTRTTNIIINNNMNSNDNTSLSDPWEWWNAVRYATNHSSKLGVALEVGATLPEEDANLDRWWGEPLKAVILKTDAFLTNRRGYPTLSKRHQEFLVRAFQRNIQIVLAGEPKHSPGPEQPVPSTTTAAAVQRAAPLCPPSLPLSSSGSANEYPSLADSASMLATTTSDAERSSSNPLRVYWEYLSFVFRKQPVTGETDTLEFSYRDFLQAPLQPLQDNLESQTYETFERDGTKYKVYGEAVRQALVDTVPPTEAATTVIVLMVVGAGRGPLVSASIAAAHAAHRRLRIWAVEKNPNAVVHLNARAAAEGWSNVTIVHADMRDWKAPEPADILVSELLGSFGDNELSPECLDGAQRFLRPGGISIPQAYTSFLQPITAHKLWTDVNAYNDVEHFETPFVVKFHRCTPLAPSQPLFTFNHPNLSHPVIDNSRQGTLSFTCRPPQGTICHGFAGYFDAHLYKNVHLSILPETHTPDMSSWFPIYFPIRQPFYVPAGAEMRVSMWRCCSRQHVWYEWAVSVAPSVVSAVHNPNGRSYKVGL
jgi:protein arginine N-methyltransferase 5